jgi:outer membrane receptor protein involved in Fe transport
VSFNIFENFAITAEGLNLTNQTSNRYAYEGQEAVTQYASSGRVFRLGARVTF